MIMQRELEFQVLRMGLQKMNSDTQRTSVNNVPGLHTTKSVRPFLLDTHAPTHTHLTNHDRTQNFYNSQVR